MNFKKWEKFEPNLPVCTLDLSCPNRKRLEVSKNVKYIAVTSRASKLQVSKVGNSGIWTLASFVNQFPYVKWLTREARVHIPARSNFEDLYFEALEVTAMCFMF